MIVNWVKEDEELLEPYEWCQGDDIEIISTLQCFRVDKKTLHDFIYGCLHLFESQYFGKVFALGDGKIVLAVEIDEYGKLAYRSVFAYADRKILQQRINHLKLTKINYQLYDEAEIKEYGLTREERIKKQFIENKLEELYLEDYESFLALCQQLNIHEENAIQKYEHLEKMLENGYSFIHELLYHELRKKEYKKK